MKKRMFLALLVAVAAMVLLATPVFATAIRDIGQLTVMIEDVPLITQHGEPYWTQLQRLIDHAEILIRAGATVQPPYVASPAAGVVPNFDGVQVTETPDTGYYPTDSTVRPGVWAAPSFARATFQAAIDAARMTLSLGSFSHNQEFDITIGIAQSATPGFAGMIMQFGFPEQLEVVRFTDHLRFLRDFGDGQGTRIDDRFNLHTLATPHFRGYFRQPLDNVDDLTSVIRHRQETGADGVTRNIYHAGFAGMDTRELTYSGNLFTFTVRVVDGNPGDILPEIQLRVSNALPPYRERPTALDMTPVRLTLPDGQDSWTAINPMNPDCLAYIMPYIQAGLPTPVYRNIMGSVGQVVVAP